MNQPVPVRPVPNLSPLLQWLEDNKVIAKGTTDKVDLLARKVKGLGEALKQGGIRF